MDFQKFIALVRARRWFLGVFVVVAGVVGFGVSSAQSDRFSASAQVLFGGSGLVDSVVAGGSGASVAGGGQAARSLALASLDSVAARVKRRFPGLGSVEALKGSVSVEVPGQSDDLVSVSARWGSAVGAARVANAFADEIVALRGRVAQGQVQRAIDAVNATVVRGGLGAAQVGVLRDRLGQLEVVKALQTGDATVVQRAVVPDSRSSPRPVRAAVLGGFVGGLLGLLVVVVGAVFDERVRGEEEVVALIAAPVLARIPDLAGPGRRTPTWTAHQSPAFADAIAFLRMNLQLKRSDRGSAVLAVTSPVEGDGKTTVVARLARSLASTGASVLAVDCNMRNPTLHRCFELLPESEPEEREAKRGSTRRPMSRRTALPGLRILSPGAYPALPAGIIGQARLRRTISELRRDADYVLVDTSPVTTVADASAVAAAADGVILVVDAKRIRRSALLAANEQLVNARATVLGIVLNRVAPRVPARHPAERSAVDDDAGVPSPPTFAG
jgi:capsular exopolysaccharide synthesis family protein